MVGFGFGGSGAVSVSTTFGVPLPQVTHPVTLGVTDGGFAFRSPLINRPVTGGTFEALTPTLSGTRDGSSVLVTPSVLTGSVRFRSTGASAICLGRRTVSDSRGRSGSGVRSTGGIQLINISVVCASTWAS